MASVPRYPPNNLEVKLYDRDLTTPVFVADLSNEISNLRFSTKLHGGFDTCSFRLKSNLFKSWEWIKDRMFYRVIVADRYKTLFEGRLQDISITTGYIDLVFYGYYENLKDIPYITAYNDVASTVIKAVLTANCSQISGDQSNISTTDITITSAANETYLDLYPNELVEKLLEFSDSSQNKYYFAIWEDRKAYLTARSISSLDWRVELKDLSNFNLNYKGDRLWNAAYAVYEAGGVVTRTADQDDSDSQDKYFERKMVVQNLGAIALATAQAQRDSVVAESKDIYPYLENITLSDVVYDAYGVPFPSYWVRAGEVIRIRDLVPASVDAGAVTRDTLRTFFILGTEYDSANMTNRLTLDTEPGNIIDKLKLELKALKQLKNKL